jgi:hypothetical protein
VLRRCLYSIHNGRCSLEPRSHCDEGFRNYGLVETHKGNSLSQSSTTMGWLRQMPPLWFGLHWLLVFWSCVVPANGMLYNSVFSMSLVDFCFDTSR